MLASLALLLSFPQESTEPWPVTGLPREDLVCEAILAEAEKDNQVMDHLRELVDGIGPRLTSSSNLSEAVSWAEDRFLDFGIPNVRRVQWGEFPVGFDRRLMQGRVVEPIKMPLILATRAWSPGTDGSERGPLLLGPSNDEELEASRGSFQNSWVLLTGTKSPRFDSDADNFRARLGKFFDEEGIYGTVRIARNELVLTGGRYKIDWNDLPTRTQVTIPKEQGRKLAQFLEAGESNYTYVHHTQHDIYDNAVPRYEEHSAKVIAMSAWRLANMDQMLPREDILNRNRENNRSSRNRKMLGVFLSEDDGLLIDRLVKDGLSEKAGLKPGDRFTEIAGQKLSSQGDLRRALREDEDIKQIAILRDGKTLKSTFNWKEKTATPLEEEMVAE